MIKTCVLLGAGFIGQYLTARLSSLGFVVRVIDRNRCPSEFAGIVEWHTCDFLNLSEMGWVFDGADYVYNLMPVFADDLKSSLKINSKTYIATQVLIDLVQKNRVHGIMFASSSAVYGNHGHVAVNESSIASPISYYGESKLILEDVLKTASSFADVNILRIANPYGATMSGGFASGFVGVLAKKITHNEKIELANGGNIYRDYIYIDDLVDGMIQASTTKSQRPYNIYNVGNNKSYSLLDIISVSEDVLKNNIAYSFGICHRNDILYSCLDSSRATLDFFFKPKVTLRDGLELVYKRYGLC